MNAHQITLALNGRWRGRSGTARCPAHQDHHPSLSVTDGDGGKALIFCHAGCDQDAVIDALRRLQLWPERSDRSRFEQRRNWAERKPDPRRDAKIGCARDIWRLCQPAAGTVVETYLKSRDIAIKPPLALRYFPNLMHQPTGLTFPAMVAAVTDVTGKVVAVHRTFLAPDGHGKAEIEPDKMMLGSVKGGAVRLAKAGLRLVVAEGIETALSVQVATAMPTWAALSEGGIRNLILPPRPLASEVIIAADHDAAGIAAAHEAADRWWGQGRRVKIALPPEPGTDFNDLLRQGTLAGLAGLAGVAA